jgi:hypothetical protein
MQQKPQPLPTILEQKPEPLPSMFEAPKEAEEEEPIIGSASHYITNSQRKIENDAAEKRASISQQISSD